MKHFKCCSKLSAPCHNVPFSSCGGYRHSCSIMQNYVTALWVYVWHAVLDISFEKHPFFHIWHVGSQRITHCGKLHFNWYSSIAFGCSSLASVVGQLETTSLVQGPCCVCDCLCDSCPLFKHQHLDCVPYMGINSFTECFWCYVLQKP